MELPPSWTTVGQLSFLIRASAHGVLTLNLRCWHYESAANVHSVTHPSPIMYIPNGCQETLNQGRCSRTQKKYRDKIPFSLFLGGPWMKWLPRAKKSLVQNLQFAPLNSCLHCPQLIVSSWQNSCRDVENCILLGNYSLWDSKKKGNKANFHRKCNYKAENNILPMIPHPLEAAHNSAYARTLLACTVHSQGAVCSRSG